MGEAKSNVIKLAEAVRALDAAKGAPIAVLPWQLTIACTFDTAINNLASLQLPLKGPWISDVESVRCCGEACAELQKTMDHLKAYQLKFLADTQKRVVLARPGEVPATP